MPRIGKIISSAGVVQDGKTAYDIHPYLRC